jgi:hypothetical protein
MAGEDDEVIVALSGDTSTTDVKVVEPGKAGTQSVSFNDEEPDPVADLKKQFGQISGRLQTVVASQQQTEQQLHETTQRLQRAESQVVVSQIDTVDSGIAQVEQDAAAAEAAYARAFEAGDGMGMARATRAMQRAENDRAQLVEAKSSLQEAAKRQPTQQQREQPQQRRQPADPVEAVAASLSPKSAAWIRAHPECVTDPKANARMMAAHNLAIADDVALDSEEYFERIEAGIKPAKKQQEQQVEKKASDGRRPSSAAASGGATGGGLNGGATTVKLTKGEAASATDGTLVWNYDDPTGQKRFAKGDPIGLAEMARRKHEGQKAGLYDKSNFEA